MYMTVSKNYDYIVVLSSKRIDLFNGWDMLFIAFFMNEVYRTFL